MTRSLPRDRLRPIIFLRFASLFLVAAAWRHKVQEASLLAVSMEGSQLASMNESSEAVDMSKAPPALSNAHLPTRHQSPIGSKDAFQEVPPDTSRVAVDDLDRYIEDANLPGPDFSPSYREILRDEFPMVYGCSLQDYSLQDYRTDSATFTITVVGNHRKTYLLHPEMTAEDLQECIAIRQNEGLQPTDFYLMCGTSFPLGAKDRMKGIQDARGVPLCEVVVNVLVLGGMANGNVVEWQDYDFVALLKAKDNKGSIASCTGSLVQGSENPSTWYFLSAAHCTKVDYGKKNPINKDPSRYTVIVHSKFHEHEHPFIDDVVSIPSLRLHAIVVSVQSRPNYLIVRPLQAYQRREKGFFSKVLKSMSKKEAIEVHKDSVFLLREKEVSVVKVNVHPNYRPGDRSYDVAIFTLGKVLLASERPLHSYKTIATTHPLCLDFTPMTQGENVHLAAFGSFGKGLPLQFVVEDSGLRAGEFMALPDFVTWYPKGGYSKSAFAVGLREAMSMPGDSGGPYWREVRNLNSTKIRLRATHGGGTHYEPFCVVSDNTKMVDCYSGAALISPSATEVRNGDPGHFRKIRHFFLWRKQEEICINMDGVTCWPKLSYITPLSHSEAFIRGVVGDDVAC